jgi:hypothetical protein
MDKKYVIIGGLVVLGLGAYFYFKPKKIGTDSSMSGLPPANTYSQINVPPTGEVITSPEEVEKIAQKIADAKALAIKIDALKTERRQIALQPSEQGRGFGGIGGERVQILIRSVRTKELDTQIADLEKLITDLGYAEVNGKITKIV